MPEEMRLWATIVPRIDLTSLRDTLSQAFQETLTVNLAGAGAGSAGGASGGQSGASTSGSLGKGPVSGVFVATDAATSNELARAMTETQHNMYNAANQAYDVRRVAENSNRAADELIEADAEEQQGDRNKQLRYLQMTARSSAQFAGMGISLLKNTFGILEDIYGRIKAASPLLQTIESLFQLAMTLFFMPLGNKLAEIMLPAVLELVDNVVDMWDAFEGMTLSEMFEYAFEYGVGLFSGYIIDIGSMLEDQGGLLGTIGTMLTTIGNFIQNNGYDVLVSILNIVNFVMDHLKEIVSLIVAFYAMQYAANLTSMMVQASTSGWGGLTGIGVAAAAGMIAGFSAYAGMSIMGFADGGHVDARPGGHLAIVGEGGEGEWIIPDSKMDSMGGNYITNNFYGYTNDDIIQLVRDETNSQIALSKLKGGF